MNFQERPEASHEKYAEGRPQRLSVKRRKGVQIPETLTPLTFE